MLRFLQRKVWPPNFRNPPWGSARSIYDHIAAHIDPEKQIGLSEEGYRLPDEPDPDPNRVSFMPGAIDGMFGRHGSSEPEEQLVSELYSRLKLATENASEYNIKALYSLIKDNSAIDVIDALIERIRVEQSLDAARLYEIVYWFTTKAADREPVKFSMSLLGLLRGSDDSEVFLTLGRHDEFALYSAVAISCNTGYGEKVLWRLAKAAAGWGRISAVERLAKTSDPEVKSWLIREGYKNDVMYEYLACICARAGDLHLALQADHVDDGLFNSAREIIETLISGEGGPAEGLADYEHGCAAIGSLLEQGKGRFSSASHYWFLCKLKQRIDAHLSGERKIGQDWSDVSANEIASKIAQLLARDSWKAVISNALETGGRQEFWDASRACERLGIDPWPYFFQRTAAGEDYWWDLMRTSDSSRIDQVLELGLKHIPLDQIATGPSSELGLGPKYAGHMALDLILQDLGNFPGKGWAFIAAGLQSPVTRNRNMAIRALSHWDRKDWPQDALAALNSLKVSEPENDVRRRIDDLLAGNKID